MSGFMDLTNHLSGNNNKGNGQPLTTSEIKGDFVGLNTLADTEKMLAVRANIPKTTSEKGVIALKQQLGAWQSQNFWKAEHAKTNVALAREIGRGATIEMQAKAQIQGIVNGLQQAEAKYSMDSSIFLAKGDMVEAELTGFRDDFYSESSKIYDNLSY